MPSCSLFSRFYCNFASLECERKTITDAFVCAFGKIVEHSICCRRLEFWKFQVYEETKIVLYLSYCQHYNKNNIFFFNFQIVTQEEVRKKKTSFLNQWKRTAPISRRHTSRIIAKNYHCEESHQKTPTSPRKKMKKLVKPFLEQCISRAT